MDARTIQYSALSLKYYKSMFSLNFWMHFKVQKVPKYGRVSQPRVPWGGSLAIPSHYNTPTSISYMNVTKIVLVGEIPWVDSNKVRGGRVCAPYPPEFPEQTPNHKYSSCIQWLCLWCKLSSIALSKSTIWVYWIRHWGIGILLIHIQRMFDFILCYNISIYI